MTADAEREEKFQAIAGWFKKKPGLGRPAVVANLGKIGIALALKQPASVEAYLPAATLGGKRAHSDNVRRVAAYCEWRAVDADGDCAVHHGVHGARAMTKTAVSLRCYPDRFIFPNAM